MNFNPRTATQAEFEAEARRLHAARLERIQNMTPEEQQACAKFMIDGYFQRAATLHLNQLWGPEDMDIQINKCVEIWRVDNFQNSAEYAAERDRLVEADRRRAADLAAERARLGLEQASEAELADARRQDERRRARLSRDELDREDRLRAAEVAREERRLAEAAREEQERSERRRLAEEDAARVKREFAERHGLPAPEPYREPETALTFEHWLALGRPNVLSVPGRLPNKFRYPEGATDEEMWDFYSTKADFVQSGYSWNSPEGRQLGEQHNAVAQRIAQSVRDRAEAEEFADELPVDMSDKEVLAGIDGAIEFHRTKTRLQRNIDQWQAIRDALEAGEASSGLKTRVDRAASGARPGARYYDLWMAVRERIRALPAP